MFPNTRAHMSDWMTPHQRLQWQMSLELRLRKLHGDGFQDFFSSVMERGHGADFVRVRAMGSIGDKGCDGYLRSSGQLFQCYGKHHDTPTSTPTIVRKIATDYATAAGKLPHLMREWHFVHNLVDGMPIEATEKLEELELAHTAHRFGFIGPPAFEERVFALSEPHVNALLGPAATAADSMNMRVEEVARLMSAVIAGMEEPPFADARGNQPPDDKLEFNRIQGAWRRILKMSGANAAVVAEYVDRHHDPEMGKRVARVFSTRYAELDAEGHTPAIILDKLYEGITGIGSVTADRQIAAQAVLSYLFAACDIFKDHPAKVAA
jgi:hypothetical protein